jgi:methyl-accepting chemotaxis protein
MFKQLKLSSRLLILSAIGLIALCMVAAGSIRALSGSLTAERRASVQRLVESGHTLLSHYHAQAQAGAMSEADARSAAKAALKALRFGDGDYFWIHDTGLRMVMHPIKAELEGTDVAGLKDTNGKALFVEMNRVVSGQGGGFVDYTWPKPGESAPQPKISYVKGFAPWGWIVGTGVYASDLEAAFWAHASNALVLVVIGLALTLGASWWIGRSILGSLGGEPAVLAGAMQRIAGGDLSGPITVRRGDSTSVVASVARMQEDLRGMIGAVRAQADQISNAAADVARASETVRAATGGQASAAESTAAAVEEIAVSVSHVAASTDESRINSERTAQAAQQGEEQSSVASESISNVSQTVSDAAAQIQVLRQRSSEIGSIAQVIREIADQTNLLALNAAIEAARAGEQGRGFAVVADEVRSLAERTGTATAKISDVIAAVQQETNAAVESIEAITPRIRHGSELSSQAAQTLRSIQDSARVTQSRVSDVAVSMKELSAGADEIARNMETITAMAGQSADAIDRNAAATRSLEQTASQLKQLIDRFRT